MSSQTAGCADLHDPLLAENDGMLAVTQLKAQKQESSDAATSAVGTQLAALDDARQEATARLDPRRRAQLG